VLRGLVARLYQTFHLHSNRAKRGLGISGFLVGLRRLVDSGLMGFPFAT